MSYQVECIFLFHLFRRGERGRTGTQKVIFNIHLGQIFDTVTLFCYAYFDPQKWIQL